MGRTLKEIVESLPRGERAKIEARARALIAEEMSLRDLRKAIGKTQAMVARRLGVGQEAVSRLEMRGDMHLSTLRSMLEAMGGELELIARFPGRPPGPADGARSGAAPAQGGLSRAFAAGRRTLSLLIQSICPRGVGRMVELGHDAFSDAGEHVRRIFTPRLVEGVGNMASNICKQ
jgi:transcriptional regulator with XRE-family HTH domain